MTRLPKIESTKMRLPGVGMIQDLVGYRLPLVTRILVSGWLPVTTGYQTLVFMVVTGFHWLPKFRSQDGYRLPLVTRILVSGWLLVTRILV